MKCRLLAAIVLSLMPSLLWAQTQPSAPAQGQQPQTPPSNPGIFSLQHPKRAHHWPDPKQ